MSCKLEGNFKYKGDKAEREKTEGNWRISVRQRKEEINKNVEVYDKERKLKAM
jgi:hypothetical protein